MANEVVCKFPAMIVLYRRRDKINQIEIKSHCRRLFLSLSTCWWKIKLKWIKYSTWCRESGHIDERSLFSLVTRQCIASHRSHKMVNTTRSGRTFFIWCDFVVSSVTTCVRAVVSIRVLYHRVQSACVSCRCDRYFAHIDVHCALFDSSRQMHLLCFYYTIVLLALIKNQLTRARICMNRRKCMYTFICMYRYRFGHTFKQLQFDKQKQFHHNSVHVWAQ